MTSPTQGATVVIGLFSGRSNPEFSIAGEALKKLSELISETIGTDSIHAPPAPLLGEYYGMRVHTVGELGVATKFPENFSVYKNVLSVDKGRKQEHWRDTAKVEEFLIQQAIKNDYGYLLESFGVQSQPNRVSS